VTGIDGASLIDLTWIGESVERTRFVGRGQQGEREDLSARIEKTGYVGVRSCSVDTVCQRGVS
jgi:hypothetical protein